MAHKAGVHRTYVGRLERGESGVTVEALAAILAALGVSLGDFFRPFAEDLKTGGYWGSPFIHTVGCTFAFSRNRLPGSYVFLISTSRS